MPISPIIGKGVYALTRVRKERIVRAENNKQNYLSVPVKYINVRGFAFSKQIVTINWLSIIN